MKNPYRGCLFLATVVVIWVASSTTIQHVLSTYPKPYTLTYITTSLFSLYLLSFKLKSTQMKISAFLKLSAKFCPLWFFANYFFNISLNMTSLASNTILASTSGIFTLIFSITFLRTPSTLSKWSAVLISFLGIFLISVSENSTDSETLLGDLFALFGAIVYSLYSVCLTELQKDDTIFVFGCIGLINFLTLMPGIPLLDLIGVEIFAVPPLFELSLMVLNALIGSMFCDLLWAWSIDDLTPTICTLGLALTIPISMGVDKCMKNSEFEKEYLIGAFLVVVGFFIIYFEEDERKVDKFEEAELFEEEI